ncbi:unnamed protein product [Lactuca virosa]|uniref:SWIM-type domain-containing protein n=1 Tax=Lactuca virosa TaxID=75947 RepID=A0AAU9PBH4_9ASTR|nr:unnamed protein product [Lactuca virosa]
MASSSGTKKVKGPEKVYVRDEDSDDDLIDFSFLDFAPETFKPTSNLSDDPFLNILCDENMLRMTLDGMGDDDQEAGVKDPEHDHIDDQNDGEVGVKYRVHDPDIHWKQMKPVVGECYESPSQLRFYHQAATVSQRKGDYGPNTLEKIKEFGKHMSFWIVIPSGGALFETRHGYSAYKVDLDAHSCSCRLWEISGLPCVHAQAAINFTHRDPTDFISFWYHKDKFIEIYKDNILPVNGSNMWPYTEYLKPLPPLVRRMPGRPKTKRRRHASECQDSKFPTQKAKVSRTVRCGKCRELGHNKLSCKNGEGLSDPVPKRKNGRPKGDGGGNLAVNIAKTPKKVDKGKKKVVEGTSKEANEGHNKVVDHTSKEASEGKMKAAEGTSKEAGKMIDVDQSISPLKRMKMMARRGGKIKYVRRIGAMHGSISQTVAGVDEAVLTCHEKLDHEDFETIKDLQASGYDHGEIVEAFNKLTKERKDVLVESIVDEETSQETQDPLVRKRKPSERIIKIKLKKAVHDPDGGGSTTEKALTLD